ncbi:MAG: hypothetical protein KKD48_01935 [Nanoarchaeota archaeon]|nr:hypothetical protein [Nanoarchaeota archaeon]
MNEIRKARMQGKIEAINYLMKTSKTALLAYGTFMLTGKFTQSKTIMITAAAVIAMLDYFNINLGNLNNIVNRGKEVVNQASNQFGQMGA